MSLIDFEVSRSKVKVTAALTAKSLSPNNLRFLGPTVFIFGVEVSHD
jgi:hypothetical protein